RLRFSGPKTSIICSPMTSLKTSIKTITYLSDIGCLEIQGASLTTIKSSVSKPSILPWRFISTMGQQGRQGALPPVSIRATKDAWTCASK
ncbi:hypothetical protein JZM00_23385, partial [Escherichia coli]|uniref:hypothetical protein n=1 Tax=Escherichia coli TaxID=562 RepID=UPI001DE76F6B|nr:hypothetical protein [Escherichia coli]MBN6229973.1 hypothetical protein [Escherichia coli]